MADIADGQVAGKSLDLQKDEQASSPAGTISKTSSTKQFASTLPSKPTTVTHTESGCKSQPTSATGSEDALSRIRAARGDAAAPTASPEVVASTIIKAKEALAKARASASPYGSLQGSHSTMKVAEGVVMNSDKPFTLYGRPDAPKPKAPVHITAPTSEEHARRKAWLAEKEAMKQRRLAQEQARKEREIATKAAVAAERAEAHKKLMKERKARYETFKAREAEMLAKSEQAWKHYQEQRGRPPLFKLMEEEYQQKKAAEEETRRVQYETNIAAGKMATVSQLVKGEVVVKPPAGSLSHRRSHSPGGTVHSSLGSGQHNNLMGRLSPSSSMANIHSQAAARAAAGKSLKWPGASSAAAAVSKQLVDRACSPLMPDGSVPPGAKVVSTRLGRVAEAQRSSPSNMLSNTTAQQATHPAEEQEQRPQQAPVQRDNEENPEVPDEEAADGGAEEYQGQSASEAGAVASDDGIASEPEEEERLQESEAEPEGADVLGHLYPAAAVVGAEGRAQQDELQQDQQVDSEQSGGLSGVDEQQQQEEQPEEQYYEEQEQDDGSAAEVVDTDAAQRADKQDDTAAGSNE